MHCSSFLLSALLPIAASALAAVLPAQQAPAALDLRITGARVLDGTGNPWFRADVGIRQGRIVAVGRLGDWPAARELDARGLVLAPGFIDLHSHAEVGLASRDETRRAAPNLVSQGITTVVVNQDGRSPAPIAAQRRRFAELGIGPDAILLVGHGTIRRQVMKSDFRRRATEAEIEAMQDLVRKAMADGAYGMSAGLEYVPGRYSDREEMVALVSALSPGAVYIVHERASGLDPMWFLPSRDEPGAPNLVDNIEELIEVAERTGITTVATHIKAKGVNAWGASSILIRQVEAARARGVPIYADQYPYTTSGTDGRVVLIPGWVRREAGAAAADPAAALEKALAEPATAERVRLDVAHEIRRRGGADQIVVLDHPDRSLIGKTLRELARMRGTSPVEAAIQLQLEGYRDRPGGARVRGFSMSEQDVEAFARQPWVATATDAGIALPEDGPVHPRFYGSYPRRIRRYALDRGVVRLEDAVRSATSLPAQILGLRDRGLVREGCRADLVLFDPDRIADRATAFEPHRYSEGIEHVLVGGVFVVENGEPTLALPGKVIPGPAAVESR